VFGLCVGVVWWLGYCVWVRVNVVSISLSRSMSIVSMVSDCGVGSG